MSQPTFRRALHISSVTQQYICLRRTRRSWKCGSQTLTIRCQMSRCASNNGHSSTELSTESSEFIVFTKLSQKFFAATGSSRRGPSSNTTIPLAIDRGTVPHQSRSNYRQTRRPWFVSLALTVRIAHTQFIQSQYVRHPSLSASGPKPAAMRAKSALT